MTDPDFRRFIGAEEGPQWICRRTVIWAKSQVRLETQQADGNAMPEPTRDRPSRNYEFLFLFSKRPDYYFDRAAIDVPSRTSSRLGVRSNAGSVWTTQCDIVSDTGDETNGLWRVNSEASPYRHIAMWPRPLVRQMLLPSARPGDIVLDPFAGSGTTGEVALDLGMKAILIEAAPPAQAALEHRVSRLNGSLQAGLTHG